MGDRDPLELRRAILDAIPEGGPGIELALLGELLATGQRPDERWKARELIEVVVWALMHPGDQEAWARVERGYLAAIGVTERRQRVIEYVQDALESRTRECLMSAVSALSGGAYERADVAGLLIEKLRIWVAPEFGGLKSADVERELGRATLKGGRGRGRRGADAVATKLAELCGAFDDHRGGAHASAFRGAKARSKSKRAQK